ncbi:MAG: hypothetical protein FWF56_05655 [Firmicutes bacterium]|nr:hypothetical protein [Bacillota bacterium]MCL1953691.1 hypothetical protein [Bacillota bacterium]
MIERFKKSTVVLLTFALLFGIICLSCAGVLLHQRFVQSTAQVDAFTEVLSVDFGDDFKFVSQQVQGLKLVEVIDLNNSVDENAIGYNEDFREIAVVDNNFVDLDWSDSVPIEIFTTLDIDQYRTNFVEYGDIVVYKLTNIFGDILGYANYQVDYVANLPVSIMHTTNGIIVKFMSYSLYDFGEYNVYFVDTNIQEVVSDFYIITYFVV